MSLTPRFSHRDRFGCLYTPYGLSDSFKMTDAHAPKDVYHKLNLVVQCLSIPIVSAAVALRFYTRFRFKQRLGVEDCEFNAQPSPLISDLY